MSQLRHWHSRFPGQKSKTRLQNLASDPKPLTGPHCTALLSTTRTVELKLSATLVSRHVSSPHWSKSAAINGFTNKAPSCYQALMLSVFSTSVCIRFMDDNGRWYEEVEGVSYEHITNVVVSARTALHHLGDTIARRPQSLFGHIARLADGVGLPALKLQVDLASGRLPGRDFKRRPGRPRNRWNDQLCRTLAESRPIYGSALCSGFVEELRYVARWLSPFITPVHKAAYKYI